MTNLLGRVKQSLVKEYNLKNNKDIINDIYSGCKVKITRPVGRKIKKIDGEDVKDENGQYVEIVSRVVDTIGICIGKRNRQEGSSIKLMVGTEPSNRYIIIIPVYHPLIKIEIISRPIKFLRSKINYLINRYGKNARIKTK